MDKVSAGSVEYRTNLTLFLQPGNMLAYFDFSTPWFYKIYVIQKTSTFDQTFVIVIYDLFSSIIIKWKGPSIEMLEIIRYD